MCFIFKYSNKSPSLCGWNIDQEAWFFTHVSTHPKKLKVNWGSASPNLNGQSIQWLGRSGLELEVSICPIKWRAGWSNHQTFPTIWWQFLWQMAPPAVDFLAECSLPPKRHTSSSRQSCQSADQPPVQPQGKVIFEHLTGECVVRTFPTVVFAAVVPKLSSSRPQPVEAATNMRATLVATCAPANWKIPAAWA